MARPVDPLLYPEKPLPPQLTLDQIIKTVKFIEDKTNTRDDVFYEVFMEQASALSAVVSVFGNAGLDALSPYKKNPNRFRSQDRWPDLMVGEHKLEGKAIKGFNTLNTHTPHGGWHIVWHYWCDRAKIITNGKVIAIVQVDVANLAEGKWDKVRDPGHLKGGDWNEGRRPRITLEDGSVEDAQSGHAHNYTLNRFGIAKLKQGTVYRLPTFAVSKRGLVASSEVRETQSRL